MITGFNSDVKYKGLVYHVQTEDKGRTNPVVESLVYARGEILYSRRTSYQDLVDEKVESDAIATLLYLFAGGSLECRSAADVNDDGAVDMSDAVAELATMDEARQLLTKESRARTNGLKVFERIKRIALLPEVLDASSGARLAVLVDPEPARHVSGEGWDALGVNTLEIPVYWEQFEPQPRQGRAPDNPGLRAELGTSQLQPLSRDRNRVRSNRRLDSHHEARDPLDHAAAEDGRGGIYIDTVAVRPHVLQQAIGNLCRGRALHGFEGTEGGPDFLNLRQGLT